MCSGPGMRAMDPPSPSLPHASSRQHGLLRAPLRAGRSTGGGRVRARACEGEHAGARGARKLARVQARKCAATLASAASAGVGRMVEALAAAMATL